MNRKFVILTDSGCDMPEDYLIKNEIELVRLGFVMDGEEYMGEDGKDIDTHAFYERLKKGAKPVTNQINVYAATAHIEKRLTAGKDVLCIVFSGGLSGTINSFVTAAKELNEKYPERKVVVVDSLCASMGQGLLVDYAVKKAESGADIEATAEYLEGIKSNICHFFTVDNLFHLNRGGRISMGTAILGSILSIKPILHVDDSGHLVSIGKVLGRKKSIKSLFDKVKENQAMGADDPVFISHGDCESEANLLADTVRAAYPEKQVMVHYIGPVIGAHAGGNTIAIFFKGKNR